MTLKHNTGGEGWSTSNTTADLGKGLYPLVVYVNGVKKTTSYNQQIGLPAATYTLDLYGQIESGVWQGGTLTIFFTDNTKGEYPVPFSNTIRAGGRPVPTILPPQGINTGDTSVVDPNTRVYSAPLPATSLSLPLQEGSTGAEVALLQTFLKSRGFLTLAYTEGVFGRTTRDALQSFQTAYGIVSGGDPASTGFGLTGPSTRTKINELLTAPVASPTVSPGPSAAPSGSGGATPFASP